VPCCHFFGNFAHWVCDDILFGSVAQLVTKLPGYWILDTQKDFMISIYEPETFWVYTRCPRKNLIFKLILWDNQKRYLKNSFWLVFMQ